MDNWQLDSRLPFHARRSKSFAPLSTRPPLLSSATRLRITSDGDVPGFPGYAKLPSATIHPAFGHWLIAFFISL